MNKKYLFTLAVLFAGTIISKAAVGFWGYGIELQTNSGTTLYSLVPSGDNYILPSGSTATLQNTAGGWNGNSSYDGNVTFNLGSFNPSTDTLILKGGSALTYQNGADTITTSAVYLNYSVVPLGNSLNYGPGINLPLNANGSSWNGLAFGGSNVPPGGNAGNNLFDAEGSSVNLLSGLTPGTYELASYGYAGSSAGDQYAKGNNGVTDFAAKFTVVPEPSSIALMLGSSLLGGLFLLRRKRA